MSTPARRNFTRSPLHVIAWRALWCIPAWVTWALLLAIVYIGWGKHDAKRVLNI